MLLIIQKILPRNWVSVIQINEGLKNTDDLIWTSDSIVSAIAIVCYLLTSILVALLTYKHLRNLEREKNSLEKYNQIASLIAHYYQLSQFLEDANQQKKEFKIIEINRILAELALWLPVDIYNKIFFSISSPDKFEKEYPVIINEIRKYFKLKPIPIENLSLVYLQSL